MESHPQLKKVKVTLIMISAATSHQGRFASALLWSCPNVGQDQSHYEQAVNLERSIYSSHMAQNYLIFIIVYQNLISCSLSFTRSWTIMNQCELRLEWWDNLSCQIRPLRLQRVARPSKAESDPQQTLQRGQDWRTTLLQKSGTILQKTGPCLQKLVPFSQQTGPNAS